MQCCFIEGSSLAAHFLEINYHVKACRVEREIIIETESRDAKNDVTTSVLTKQQIIITQWAMPKIGKQVEKLHFYLA